GIGGIYTSVYANLATNIPEIIIGIISVKNGQIQIAILSMVGSVFSNLSFVYGITILISGISVYVTDILVDLFTFITPTLGVTFTGFILVPCIGNAVEHAISIIFGIKDKMDIVIDNTGGSAIQIIYFVLPIIVISGWIMNLSVTMYFSPFITFSTFVCSFVFKLFVVD
ncbi:8028_t:CDS:2, partial [Scutellospora calospora]